MKVWLGKIQLAMESGNPRGNKRKQGTVYPKKCTDVVGSGVLYLALNLVTLKYSAMTHLKIGTFYDGIGALIAGILNERRTLKFASTCKQELEPFRLNESSEHSD